MRVAKSVLCKIIAKHFERVFQEFCPQVKKQVLCRTYALQNSHFEQNYQRLFINFSFLKVCMHLITSFTCKDTIFETVSSSSYGIFLNWTYRYHRTQVFLKKAFSKYWRNLQKNTKTGIQLQIIRYNLANMPADIRSKNCV